GVTSGTYSHTFDMTSASSYNPAFVAANGGTAASAAPGPLAGIKTGRGYLNIHNTNFGGGGNRGFFVKPVDVSVKPDAAPPVPINPRSHGSIPVAILSTSTFNAPASVNATSLTFGETGNENSLAFCGAEDVNGDDLTDLMCHFETQSSGFKSGDSL